MVIYSFIDRVCIEDSLKLIANHFGNRRPAIPCFDGHYDHWSMLMENFLRSKEYWQVIEHGVITPTNGERFTEAQPKDLKGLKLKDLKAKNYLFQAIDRSILETILCKETSKEIWDSMKTKYQGSFKVKCAQLQTLRKDFEVLQMKDESKVIDALTLDELQSSLLVHEQKMNRTSTSIEQDLKALTHSFRGRGKG
ncbi:hypothetical protein J1N35_013737 [Gossypium stocksii]|uniref:Retrovirus-related Pol polyprotein from transposon TNT 1-94 n=1 Tax=Gossypium stocksii TaxID=47602 RepID=A0A9D4A939_9ROSI|nr:hypothetical protein J1N35_013737 [Gossypium stocksii]